MARPGTTTKAEPDPEKLAALLRDCGIVLTPDQIERLWTYHLLLRRRNPELNLTRIHRFENMVLKLYADSILPGQLIDLPSPLLDLGTGPGMPGIPLKIAHPRLAIHLAEGRGRRVDFLREAVATLALDQVTIIDRAITVRHTDAVNAVITRAVEPIADTLARIAGCLAAGGLAVFMKGPSCGAEIEEAASRFAGSYRLEMNADYRIGDSPHRRKLVVWRRIDPPKPITAKAATVIQSQDNGLFKDLKKLLTGRGIKKQGRAIVAGARIIADIQRRSPGLGRLWLKTKDQPEPPANWQGVKTVELAPALFAALDVFGTQTPLLVIETPPPAPWHPGDGLAEGCTLMVPFQDPENVGAVIRSAAAFGVKQVIILAEGANPFHPKAIRASGGAVLAVTLWQGPSINDLPAGLPLIGLSAEGRDLATVAFPERFALLPGLEGPGLPRAFRAAAVAVPMQGEVESLNAAAATAVVLYVWGQGRCNVRG